MHVDFDRSLVRFAGVHRVFITRFAILGDSWRVLAAIGSDLVFVSLFAVTLDRSPVLPAVICWQRARCA